MTAPRHRRPRPLTRRQFVARMAALTAGAWAAPTLSPGLREARARTAGSVADPTGTTLERAIVTTGTGPYFRLAYGPGWPIVVRSELAEPKPGREARRAALTGFLHVTDYQLVDAQSPARVEFLDRYADEPTPQIPFGAAQRPMEAVVPHTVAALMDRAHEVVRGPVTGRALDACVCTGDNIDNRQGNELEWFMSLHDGGTFAPNSGADDAFEGVQSFDDPVYYDPHYWHPEAVDDPRGPDEYAQFYGFPDYPGLLAAAIAPITSVGLPMPWYSCWGNHDALVQGNAPANPFFDAIARGGTKVLAPPPGWAPSDFYRGLVEGDPTAIAAFSLAPARPVTADETRGFITPEDYIRAHLDSPTAPHGHGFTEDNLDPVTLYYTFDLVPGIRGITLDTTSPGSSDGSIGQAQLDWLEQQLIAVHSRYYDVAGTETTTTNDDQLVVIFSHHRVESMMAIQGPDQQGNIEQRYGGDELEALLHRFPNVILWVNGHSHFNRVVPRPDPQGRTGGFWDVTTAAQIDPPQQARTLEIVDNRDGTLSIFSVIIDHAAPPETAVGDYDRLGLAAIGRELAYNDPQGFVVSNLGEATDRNAELVIAAPFQRSRGRAGGRDGAATGGGPNGTTVGGSGAPVLPVTGGGPGAALALGAAALGGALALRSRPRPADDAHG